MRTEVVFFDGVDASLGGMKRGLIAFCVLVLFDVTWGLIFKYNRRNIFSALTGWLIMCSLLAIQLPKSLMEAVLYSGLLGLVITLYANVHPPEEDQMKTSFVFIDVIRGLLSSVCAGVVVWFLFWMKQSR